MLKKATQIILLTFFCFVSNSLIAQNQSSNKGKQFWVGFMENSSTPLALDLHFASQFSANVNIEIPIFGNLGFSLRPGSDTLISIPVPLVYTTSSENPQKKGVFITSDTAISVIAFNNAPFSTDAISLVPLEYLPLGGKYIINTFRGSNSFTSEFMVIATEDSTLVEIIPSNTTKLGKPAGVPFTVMLQSGEVFQVQSKDSISLSGTKIKVANACKKLVVYSGSRCSQVNYNTGCSGCDHLWEQELPITLWGTDYYSVPLKGMESGYLLSFVASEDSTEITIDGIPAFTLNSGQSVTQNYNDNYPRCINANKPLSVIQLLKSGECNGHNQGLSDPSMFRLVPESQDVKSTFFRVPLTTNITFAFLTVVCSNPAEVFLDGVSINTVSGFEVSNNCNNKQIVTVPIYSQYHLLESNNGFTAYLYGYGNAESYAFAFGSAYENLTLNFTLNPSDFIYCNTQQSFNFTAINKGYTNLKWDFDDGFNATGNTTSHTFKNPGRFEVKLIGTKLDSDCEEDTVSKFITLFELPDLDLGNDTIICKDPDFLIVPKTNPNYSFEWQNGSHAKNYLASQNELIKLTVTNNNGCQVSDSIFITFDDCIEKKIEFPNVFTPGNDGYNDEFQITIEVYENTKCIIFNRWGIELYNYDPKVDKAWNGGVSNDLNQPCPSGLYYFLIYFSDPDTGENFVESGTITLIRGN